MNQKALKTTQIQVQPPVEPAPVQSNIEFKPEEFDRAINDLGRALAVYFTWKSAGLLDR